MSIVNLRKIQIVAFFDIRNEDGEVVAEGSLNNNDGQPHVIDVFAGNLRDYLDAGGGLDQFLEASKAQLALQAAQVPESESPSPNRAARRAKASASTKSANGTAPKGIRHG